MSAARFSFLEATGRICFFTISNFSRTPTLLGPRPPSEPVTLHIPNYPYLVTLPSDCSRRISELQGSLLVWAHPGYSLHLKVLTLVTSEKSLWPCKVTNSQVLRTKNWPFLRGRGHYLACPCVPEFFGSFEMFQTVYRVDETAQMQVLQNLGLVCHKIPSCYSERMQFKIY